MQPEKRSMMNKHFLIGITAATCSLNMYADSINDYVNLQINIMNFAELQLTNSNQVIDASYNGTVWSGSSINTPLGISTLSND